MPNPTKFQLLSHRLESLEKDHFTMKHDIAQLKAAEEHRSKNESRLRWLIGGLLVTSLVQVALNALIAWFTSPK